MENFRNWLATQNISPEARATFEESITCFRADAYKASVLFAYLGMLHVVKDRILRSSPPTGYTAPHWSNIHNGLNNYDTWDAKVLEALVQQNPAPIFSISDDLRHQLRYWKNRRNDCAHSKPNSINAGYATALYAFIMSNLSKLVVIGSRDNLINKVQDHYNLSLTPPNQPTDQLANEVQHAIASEEQEDFFSEAIEFLGEVNNSNYLFTYNRGEYEFIHKCLNQSTPEVRSACSRALLLSEERLLQFLRSYPSDVGILNGHLAETRQLWREKIFEDSFNDFPLFVSLLHNNLIPVDEKEEAYGIVLEKSNGTPSGTEDHTLRAQGFYIYLHEHLITNDNISRWSWSNPKRTIITHYILTTPITEDIAVSLSSTFDARYHPFDLASSLNNMFRDNPNKVEEFHQHVSDDLEVPEFLPSLEIEEDEDGEDSG